MYAPTASAVQAIMHFMTCSGAVAKRWDGDKKRVVEDPNLKGVTMSPYLPTGSGLALT